LKALREAVGVGTFGEASLQNLLMQGQAMLDALPLYASREIIVLFGSISTCDAGDIHATIRELRDKKIMVSVVSVTGAEVFVLKSAAHETGGKHIVPMNEEHIQLCLHSFLQPPPVRGDELEPSLIRMGFPILRTIPNHLPARKCLNDLVERRIGYECPRCQAWLSDVPMECVLCGLTLLSSPHLARSYHHLFPVQTFGTVAAKDGQMKLEDAVCSACMKAIPLEYQILMQCPRCKQVFCEECDAFIHSSLHNCPGCENSGLLLFE